MSELSGVVGPWLVIELLGVRKKLHTLDFFFQRLRSRPVDVHQLCLSIFIIIIFIFIWPCCVACGIVPHVGLNLQSLYWKHGVLTPGSPRVPLLKHFREIFPFGHTVE